MNNGSIGVNLTLGCIKKIYKCQSLSRIIATAGTYYIILGSWLLLNMLVTRLSVCRSLCRASYSTAPSLTSVGDQDVAHFSKILSPSSIISTFPPISSPKEELDSYNVDWIGRHKGLSTTVLKPKTTQEVGDILKWCNDKRLGVVPQGGNTGLVGGGVPVKDEIILSLSNMNKVRSFDSVSGPSNLSLSYSLYLLPEQGFWLPMQAVFSSP